MTDETAAFDAVHYKESRPASHLYARQRQKDGIRPIDSSGYQVGRSALQSPIRRVGLAKRAKMYYAGFWGATRYASRR